MLWFRGSGLGFREYGSFRKFGVPYFGVLKIRILLFRVLYLGPLFSEKLPYSFVKAMLGLEIAVTPALSSKPTRTLHAKP